MPRQTNEIALIGAGPVGIEVAVALKKAGLDYVHIESGQIGQTIYWFAPQTRFFSSSERIAIAGVPLQTADQGKCSRESYLAYLRMIVEMFDLEVHTFERVSSIKREGHHFDLVTTRFGGEAHYRVRKLILATGGTAGARRLGIPGENQENVHHAFQDPHLYFHNRVLIVGGRNSAVEAALRCHHAGARVAISYRRSGFDPAHIKYWLYPEITGLTNSGRIAGHFNTQPLCIDGDSVTLSNTLTGQVSEVRTDFVLALIGFHADMTLERMAGVELEGEAEIPRVNPQTMETNVPGVFVAGTATGGTQDQFRIFIENCHNHAERIVAALTGRQAQETPVDDMGRPES